MTQHDAAVLANLTVDMVKKYESEKYRIQPSGRMREMLEHYLAEHRRAVVAIVELIAAGFVALLVVVALAVGLVTHPIRTLALVFHKLAALSAGLALILALIAWFWTDHTKPDFVPCFWGSIGVIVASILIRAFAEWILKRPTRAERRATKRAAAQETGRVTMRMPVSEEVAAAFESTRDGRRASL